MPFTLPALARSPVRAGRRVAALVRRLFVKKSSSSSVATSGRSDLDLRSEPVSSPSSGTTCLATVDIAWCYSSPASRSDSDLSFVSVFSRGALDHDSVPIETSLGMSLGKSATTPAASSYAAYVDREDPSCTEMQELFAHFEEAGPLRLTLKKYESDGLLALAVTHSTDGRVRRVTFRAREDGEAASAVEDFAVAGLSPCLQNITSVHVRGIAELGVVARMGGCWSAVELFRLSILPSTEHDRCTADTVPVFRTAFPALRSLVIDCMCGPPAASLEDFVSSCAEQLFSCSSHPIATIVYTTDSSLADTVANTRDLQNMSTYPTCLVRSWALATASNESRVADKWW